jgi:hypothetical protein
MNYEEFIEMEQSIHLNPNPKSHGSDEYCYDINHERFEKYIGLNRFVVCILLQILNPSKRVIMYNQEKIMRPYSQAHTLFPLLKNTINIFYNCNNKVIKIRCNSVKKIE